MAWFALAMLGVGLVLMVTTGWASYAVLLLVACITAAVGVAVGGIEAAWLGALPQRIVGLLEHDLLQAIALYALLGALLRESDLADSAFAFFARALQALRLPAAPRAALAGFGVGALAAPMNGSVAASTSMLVHAALPRWREAGLGDARATALTAVASTLGVIVPPSLVLLLFGDAMLRAHTEALTLAGTSGVRVINTQDVVQACAPVALLLALAWAATAWWRTRGVATAAPALPESSRARAARPIAAGGVASLAVATLLAMVALGWVRPVEAAATATLAALIHAAASARLSRGGLERVLSEAMSLTGALFALLLAAATLSLVLRAAGCDKLVSEALAPLKGHPVAATLLVLAVLLALAFVLDAIELVFLVVPLVMPPLLAQVPDAGWVACLTLLALQAGFLLPPWGYAVVLTRSLAPDVDVSRCALARELVPYLVALLGVAAIVCAFPAITHWLRSAPMTLETTVPDSDVDEMLRQMTPPSGDEASH